MYLFAYVPIDDLSITLSIYNKPQMGTYYPALEAYTRVRFFHQVTEPFSHESPQDLVKLMFMHKEETPQELLYLTIFKM